MSNTTPPPSTGPDLLAATAGQLRARRDALEPLMAEYERLDRIREAFGEIPEVDGAGAGRRSAAREHAQLVGHLHKALSSLTAWSTRIEPLVHEYHRILHVLAALDAADAMSPEVARRRGGGAARSQPRSAPGARVQELRRLLVEPRTRAQLAEAMQLSVSRIAELLEPLARTGEVIEIPDPRRRSRKLWALANRSNGDDTAGDSAGAAPIAHATGNSRS